MFPPRPHFTCRWPQGKEFPPLRIARPQKCVRATAPLIACSVSPLTRRAVAAGGLAHKTYSSFSLRPGASRRRADASASLPPAMSAASLGLALGLRSLGCRVLSSRVSAGWRPSRAACLSPLWRGAPIAKIVFASAGSGGSRDKMRNKYKKLSAADEKGKVDQRAIVRSVLARHPACHKVAPLRLRATEGPAASVQ